MLHSFLPPTLLHLKSSLSLQTFLDLTFSQTARSGAGEQTFFFHKQPETERHVFLFTCVRQASGVIGTFIMSGSVCVSIGGRTCVGGVFTSVAMCPDVARVTWTG